MQRTPPSNSKPAPPRGVIASIAEGWSVVLARPWLALPIILVDLWYWLAWRIEPRARMDRLIDVSLRSNPDDAASIVDTLDQAGRSDLTVIAAFFLPTLLAGIARDDLYTIAARPILVSGSAGIDMLLGIIAILLGALSFIAFATPIADAVVGRSRAGRVLAAGIIRTWARFLSLILLLIAGLCAFAIPAGILVAISAVAGINLMPLLSSAMILAGVIAVLYGYFAVDAMLVADVGPIRGITFSLNIVRRNFLATLGFVFTSLFITIGIPEIIDPLLGSAPGLFVSLVLHAVIATGMVAASMVFFIDRLRHWRPEAAVTPAAPVTDASRQGEHTR